MFERLLAHRDHIPPHRVWAYLSAEVELSVPETHHLMNCPACRKILDVCLRAESFGEVLQIWLDENPPESAEASA